MLHQKVSIPPLPHPLEYYQELQKRLVHPKEEMLTHFAARGRLEASMIVIILFILILTSYWRLHLTPTTHDNITGG